jgi:hypothetical protein
MLPFGKQQELLRDLSTSSPEELSGNCRETVYHLSFSGPVTTKHRGTGPDEFIVLKRLLLSTSDVWFWLALTSRDRLQTLLRATVRRLDLLKADFYQEYAF